MSKLTPEDFGIIAIAGMFSLFTSLLCTFGTDLSINRFYWEWPESDRRANLGSIWTWNGIAAAAWAAILVPAVAYLGPRLFPGFRHFSELSLGLLANFAGHLLIAPLNTLRIKRRSWDFALYNVFAFLVSSGLAILLVVALDRGLQGYFTAQLAGNLALAVLAAIIMSFHARPCLSSPGLRGTIRYSLPVFYSNIISTVGNTLDRLLLATFANLEILGLYSLALKFAEVIGTVHTSLKMTYTAFLMKTVVEEKAGGAPSIARIVPWYTCAYFLAGLGIALFTGDYVRLIGQPEYFPIIDWVPALIGMVILSVLYLYYAPGTMTHRSEWMWIPTTVHLAALALASALLIRPFGLHGLVASRYLSGAAYLVVGIFLSIKAYPILFHWWKLWALAGLYAAGTFAGRPLDGLPVWAAIPCKALTLAAFGVICYMFILREPGSALPGDIRALLKRTKVKSPPSDPGEIAP